MASDGSGTRKSGKHGFRLKMAETILVQCPKLSGGCVLNSRAAVSMQQYDVSMIHTAKAYSQLSPASMKRSRRTSRTPEVFRRCSWDAYVMNNPESIHSWQMQALAAQGFEAKKLARSYPQLILWQRVPKGGEFRPHVQCIAKDAIRMKHELCIRFFLARNQELWISHILITIVSGHWTEANPARVTFWSRLQPGGSRLSSTTTAVSSRPATSATPWSQPSSTLPSWQDCKWIPTWWTDDELMNI